MSTPPMPPTSLVTPDVESEPPTAASAAEPSTPVLITPGEITLSTAATRAAARTRHSWLGKTLVAELGRIISEWTQPRPHYPRRELDYLEAARMSRAMDRL